MDTTPKKGTIVVVMKGILLGNEPGTITKVLSEPGALNDQVSKIIGKNKSESLKHRVMCKNMTDFDSSITYCNESSYAEAVSDLRLATENEKKIFKKELQLRKQYLQSEEYLNFSSPQLEF